MQEAERGWLWVGGAGLFLVLILGGWWWSQSREHSGDALGYAAPGQLDALEGPTAPTQPVAVAPLPGRRAAPAAGDTVAAVAQALSGSSHFAALLRQSGVAAELAGPGPYTLFVPTDESFALLPPGALPSSGGQLKRLVGYHVVAGKAIDVNAQRAGIEQALSGDMLNFSVLPSDQSARINSAVALRAYHASNGIVYVIDEVLLPPTAQGS